MNSTPLKKGFLPTSTPTHSFGDSGYFGSCDRSLVKVVHTLSPIKEVSPFKKRFTTLVEISGRNLLGTARKVECTPGIHQFNSVELVKELDFNDLSDLTESLYDCNWESFQVDDGFAQSPFPSFRLKNLSDDRIYFSRKKYPGQKDCDVRRTSLGFDKSCESPCGDIYDASFSNEYPEILPEVVKTQHRVRNKKRDFVQELVEINCTVILSKIFSYLPVEDICKVCCVNKKWNEAVLCDTHSNSRRRRFLRKKIAQKENKQASEELTAIGKRSQAGKASKTPLSNISNEPGPELPLNKQCDSKFESFLQERNNLKQGILLKCPLCHYAAKSQKDIKYICTQCNYVFCKKCLNPCQRDHKCPVPNVSIIIGSKKSKKNLKRL